MLQSGEEYGAAKGEQGEDDDKVVGERRRATPGPQIATGEED